MGDFKINEKTVFTQSGSAEPAMGSTITGIPAAGVTGVLPVGVTGGSGLTALASNPTVTLGSNATFPAGHPIAYKMTEVNGDAESTTSTTYVEAYTALRITHALSDAANKLIFTVAATKMYCTNLYTGHVDVAKTSAVSSGLSTREILHIMAQEPEVQGQSGFSVYSPGVTTEFTYTVVIKSLTGGGTFYIANGTTNTSVKFSLMEIVQ